MPPWCDPPAEPARYAVGDRVCNSYQPPSRGTVTALGDDTIAVAWDGEGRSIVYPADASYLRRMMPRE